jgi:hypothetical protein
LATSTTWPCGFFASSSFFFALLLFFGLLVGRLQLVDELLDLERLIVFELLVLRHRHRHPARMRRAQRRDDVEPAERLGHDHAEQVRAHRQRYRQQKLRTRFSTASGQRAPP